jgi:glycosyltransferase involved in cell wall biosynthesis
MKPLQSSTPVRFSIIVPTHNRAVLLDRCLTAIGAMDYPSDAFEVLIVDDGSKPPPTEVFARHAPLLPLRTFRTEGGGPARARNLALQAAVGEYIVFTDDDTRPSRQWLRAYDEAIHRHPDAGFGGAIVDSPENNIYGRTSQLLITYLYAYNETTDALRFFCSNNLAFPRATLIEMGGFDHSFPLAAAEDRYICTRWLRKSTLEFVPDAIVEHRQFLDFRGYVRQQFRYGRGACQFWRRRMSEDGAVNRLQPFHFYWDMMTFPLGRVPFLQVVPTIVLLMLSQAAGYTGYRYENRSIESRART